RWLDESVDAAQQRRLARTGKPDEHDEFPVLDVERDAVDRARAARIDLHQVLYLKRRPHGAESMEKKKAAGASGGLQVKRAEWLGGLRRRCGRRSRSRRRVRQALDVDAREGRGRLHVVVEARGDLLDAVPREEGAEDLLTVVGFAVRDERVL